MTEIIATHLRASRDAMERAADDATLLAVAQAAAEAITAALQAGRKILFVGNGGSAADAQHIAAEIVGRYKRERAGWAAIALTTDTSALTSIGNDYGFDQIFARQIEGLGQTGDVLIALSTSGRSPNILRALDLARTRGLVTIGFTGVNGTAMASSCDHLFVAPSDDTPVIQQVYMAALHGICDAVERALTA
jgi:D-sedoheptulose 7-phosphate isomerase